jgi:hypothetical protein
MKTTYEIVEELQGAMERREGHVPPNACHATIDGGSVWLELDVWYANRNRENLRWRSMQFMVFS